MKWVHPIGDVRAWRCWRESILIAEEDRIIRDACDRATDEDRAFLEKLIAEREQNKAALLPRRGGERRT